MTGGVFGVIGTMDAAAHLSGADVDVPLSTGGTGDDGGAGSMPAVAPRWLAESATASAIKA